VRDSDHQRFSSSMNGKDNARSSSYLHGGPSRTVRHRHIVTATLQHVS
jgi:hypothetical protein